MGASGAFGVLNAVMSANPIGAIIVGLIALVSGLVYFFTKTKTGIAILKTFTKFLGEAWETIKTKAEEIFTPIAEFLTGLWEGIVTTASDLFNGLKDTLSSIWEFIKNAATIAWNVLFAIVGGLILTYINIWKGIFEGLKIYLGLLWIAFFFDIRKPQRVINKIALQSYILLKCRSSNRLHQFEIDSALFNEHQILIF